jgi:hypothetical protein
MLRSGAIPVSAAMMTDSGCPGLRVSTINLAGNEGFKTGRKYLCRTSTMEKEIREAEEAGYVLVGICSRDEHVVIMEKETE